MKYLLFVLIVVFLVLFFYPRQSVSHVAPPEPEIVEPESIRAYAERRVGEEFGSGQWLYFEDLVDRESGWEELAQNPRSTAFGLCQFLNKTWQGTSYQKTTDPYIQLEACFEYVKGRYSTPQRAIIFHNRVGWY